MDKFGIFNLLNSFLGLYDKSQNAAKNENDTQPTVSSAASSPKNEPTAPQSASQKNPHSTSRAAPPLQAGMLTVMRSHDEFIKRVKEKNKVWRLGRTFILTRVFSRGFILL